MTTLTASRDALDEYLSRSVGDAKSGAPQVVDLWEDLADQLGGKLVRPRLTLATYLGLGGKDLGAVVPVAAAQELLHTAMIVHDDLLDHDETRRGRPNLAGTTRARLAAAGWTAPAPTATSRPRPSLPETSPSPARSTSC
ncbi:polyprenyl synthetase family protein [Oerskovia sp. M15]